MNKLGKEKKANANLIKNFFFPKFYVVLNSLLSISFHYFELVEIKY